MAERVLAEEESRKKTGMKKHNINCSKRETEV
jgi:hypothetical protein